jgi:hypothetical protein
MCVLHAGGQPGLVGLARWFGFFFCADFGVDVQGFLSGAYQQLEFFVQSKMNPTYAYRIRHQSRLCVCDGF